jgi:dTDP-glucose 4,6-dehydratase
LNGDFKLEKEWGGAKCPKFNIVGAEEINNYELAKIIADAQGKELNYEFVDFHSSRPGHDLRYAIDASKTISELGWKPKENSFEDKLPEVIDFYSRLEINLNKISHSGLSNKSSK